MKKWILLFSFIWVIVFVNAAIVDTVMVYSNAMKKYIPCVVVKPNEATENGKQYSVVYLLHGYSGNYRNWVKDFPGVKESVDLYKMIIVCPDGGYGSWYFDSPIDSSFRYETFVADELITYVDFHYPTIADKAHRGISGLSMGGHGAFYLALKHKNLFGAVNSMSGGVDFRAFPDNWEIKKRIGTKKSNPENWEKYTVINMLDSLKNGELKIAFDCGVGDFFLEGNRAFNAKMTALKIDHDYTERPGEHKRAYWANAVYYHLLFFQLFFNEGLKSK